MRALRKTGKPTEHQIQSSVVQWAWIMSPVYPELRLLYAIPNGGKRSAVTAAILKAEGVKAGVPDMHLPVQRRGYVGLWIEHKVGKKDLTDAQADWMNRLRLEGHLCVLSRSFEQSRDAILEYLRR